MVSSFPVEPLPPSAPDLAPSGEAPGELTRKASLNAAASLLDFVTKMAVGLVITPVLVTYLGASLFGVWEILGRLVDYIAAADGRPTDALRLVIANRQATEDATAKRRIVASAVWVWAFFLPAVACLGGVLVWLAPVVIEVLPEQRFSVRIACALLVLNFFLLSAAALPESVLRGMNLGYKRMGWIAALNVAGAVLTAGAVYAGLGLAGVAGAQVVLSLLTAGAFFVLVKRFVPWFGVARPSGSEIRGFFRLSVWSFAGDIIAKLTASDVIVLGAIASSAAVTSYVLTGYAARAVVGILSLVLLAVTPGLGGLLGQERYQRAAALRNEMVVLSWVAATAVGSTILMWNRSFLELWVGPDHYAGLWPNLLIVMLMAQTIFIRSDAYVINASLRLRGRVIMSALAAVLSVGLGATLVPSFGISGLCLGLLAGRLVQSISYPFLVRRAVRHDVAQMPRLGAFRLGAVMLILFVCSAWAGDHLVVRHSLEWAAGTAATLLLTLAAACAALGRDSRARLVRRITATCAPYAGWRVAAFRLRA